MERIGETLTNAGFKYDHCFINHGSNIVIKESIAVFIIHISNKILGFVIVLVLTRIMEISAYGVYRFALSSTSFIMDLALLGLIPLIVREVAKSNKSADLALLSSIRNASFRVAKFAVIGIFAFALVLFGILGRVDKSIEVPVITVAVGAVVFQTISAISLALIRGLGHISVSEWPLRVFFPVLFVVFVLGASTAIGINAFSVMAIYSIASFFQMCLSLFFLEKYWPKDATEYAKGFNLRSWLKSLPSIAMMSGINLINQYLDTIMLGIIQGSREVAIYAISIAGASLLALPIGAVRTVVAPRVSALFVDHNIEKLQRLYVVTTIVTSASSLTGLLFLYLGGEAMLEFAFPEGYGRAFVPMIILSISHCLIGIVGPAGSFLTMTGFQRESKRPMVGALMTNIVGNLVLIQVWGATGAAMATTLSVGYWHFGLGIVMARRIGVHPWFVARSVSRPGT